MQIERSLFAAVLLAASVFALYSMQSVDRVFVTPGAGFTMVHGVLERKTSRRLVTSSCTECEKHL